MFKKLFSKPEPIYNMEVILAPDTNLSIHLPDNPNLKNTLDKLTGQYYADKNGKIIRGQIQGLKTYYCELGVDGNGNPTDMHFHLNPERKSSIALPFPIIEKNNEFFLNFK